MFGPFLAPRNACFAKGKPSNPLGLSFLKKKGKFQGNFNFPFFSSFYEFKSMNCHDSQGPAPRNEKIHKTPRFLPNWVYQTPYTSCHYNLICIFELKKVCKKLHLCVKTLRYYCSLKNIIS